MSLLEIPPFEALTQGTSPYSGFGPLVTDKSNRSELRSSTQRSSGPNQ
jgi:hypothetical protein